MASNNGTLTMSGRLNDKFSPVCVVWQVRWLNHLRNWNTLSVFFTSHNTSSVCMIVYNGICVHSEVNSNFLPRQIVRFFACLEDPPASANTAGVSVDCGDGVSGIRLVAVTSVF